MAPVTPDSILCLFSRYTHTPPIWVYDNIYAKIKGVKRKPWSVLQFACLFYLNRVAFSGSMRYNIALLLNSGRIFVPKKRGRMRCTTSWQPYVSAVKHQLSWLHTCMVQ